MSWLNVFLSETQKKMLAQASALRSLVRKVDAPVLHKMLNEAALMLEDGQRELAKIREEADDAIDALEALRDAHVVLPYHHIALISRYRRKYPKRIKA